MFSRLARGVNFYSARFLTQGRGRDSCNSTLPISTALEAKPFQELTTDEWIVRLKVTKEEYQLIIERETQYLEEQARHKKWTMILNDLE